MTDALHLYANSIEENAALAHAALQASNPTALVPFCGEWPASELRDHISGVFAFWTHQLQQADASQAGFPDEVRARYVRPINEAAADIVELLRSAQPGQPCWNWSGSNMTSDWALRRMAHEIAVHRVDAQGTLGPGNVTPIEQELANDGIDELLDVHVGAKSASPEADAPVLLIETPQRSWTVSVGSSVAARIDAGCTPDAAIHGSASNVLLYLWNRHYPVDLVGDQTVLGAWQKLPVFA